MNIRTWITLGYAKIDMPVDKFDHQVIKESRSIIQNALHTTYTRTAHYTHLQHARAHAEADAEVDLNHTARGQVHQQVLQVPVPYACTSSSGVVV